MIYTYETLDGKKTFELQQSMKDAPLTKHPETGVKIRRVITGGTGFKCPPASNKANLNDYKDSKIFKESQARKRFY